MKKLRTAIFLLTINYLTLTTLMGCASISEGVMEGAKGIAGISTKTLEENRKTAVAQTFDYNYFDCYTKTADILTHIGSYTYAKNIKKHMIAIYISASDTTPVGLFFKEIDATHTEVQVSSPSTYAKELIAKNVFAALNKMEVSPPQPIDNK